jgi:hypothetical protein
VPATGRSPVMNDHKRTDHKRPVKSNTMMMITTTPTTPFGA